MSSFATSTGSATFTAYEDSWSEPALATVNVRGFPGGDNVAISLGGQREQTRTFTILFVSVASYRAFAALRGRTGTLSVDSWDTAGPIGAVLRQCAPQPVLPSGNVFARAEFVLT